MIITREADYALRILRHLIDGELHSAKEISAEERIPLQFTYKILKKLEHASMISITQGVKGGCRIMKSMTEINLWEVVLAVGDYLYVNACMAPDYECSRKENPKQCGYHKTMEGLQEKMEEEFRSVTLDKMLKE